MSIVLRGGGSDDSDDCETGIPLGLLLAALVEALSEAKADQRVHLRQRVAKIMDGSELVKSVCSVFTREEAEEVLTIRLSQEDGMWVAIRLGILFYVSSSHSHSHRICHRRGMDRVDLHAEGVWSCDQRNQRKLETA